MALPVTEHEPAHVPPPSADATGGGSFRGALVVATILLLVGALAWLVFGYGTGNFVDAEAKRAVERRKILADRNADDAKLLHEPATWQDHAKGLVRVPIDRAIALTLVDLSPIQPHPAYPVKQSPPQPANAPTSPSKGADAANAGTNPAASNPTVGQPSPAPVAVAPTPAPATGASNAPAAPAPVTTPAPVPDNNANHPGNPPIPGTSAQPAASTPLPAPTVPASAKPEPLTAPPTPAGTAAPTATADATPTPAPPAPVASPAGTP